MANKRGWVFDRPSEGLVKVPVSEFLHLVGAVRNLLLAPPDETTMTPEQLAAWQRLVEVCDASPFIAPLRPVDLCLLEAT